MIKVTQYQPHTPNKTHSQGFTLVELMVTIAVMGIIAAIAVPSFSSQMASKRIDSSASVIEESLRTAISESAIRRQPLTYKIDTSSSKIIIYGPGGEITDTVKTYNYNDKTQITLATSSLTEFKIGPGKRVRNTANTDTVSQIFSICDSSFSGEQMRKVSFNTLAQIKQSISGSCS